MGAGSSSSTLANPATVLPSYEAACRLYEGDPDAIWEVGLGVFSRAALIGLGMAAVGERDTSRIIRNALAGSLAVEGFVILWVWRESGKLEWKPKL